MNADTEHPRKEGRLNIDSLATLTLGVVNDTVLQPGAKFVLFDFNDGQTMVDHFGGLPDGSTWFVELKAPSGRLSELQKIFCSDMARLKQKYACLWTKEQVDGWAREAA